MRGKRDRGAAGQTPVFGVLKRGGNFSVKIVQNCSKSELLPIIQGKILEGSTVYTDGWKAYDGLILNDYEIITEFSTPKTNFLAAKITSMASNLSGPLRKEDSQNLMAGKPTME